MHWIFSLLFFSIIAVYGSRVDAREKIFQVVASWDARQTTVRSACYYNLDDAIQEKNELKIP